ncbi:MAG TPA: hypothetical protein VFU32_02160 [Ktedonobacterales bacterium]|nr:hypothetical protein [Ktedonobacterales bacterium]
METHPAHRPVSKGICAFCKAELAKQQMTQHLKSCKARRAATITPSKAQKTRLLHLVAEGQYLPEYWLHFEIPASASLGMVDDFLKAMWIEDLDHLSGFTINGTDYSMDDPDDWYALPEGAEPEAEALTVQEQEEAMREVVSQVTSAWAEGSASTFGMAPDLDLLTPEWITAIKKPRSVDELVAFLKAERASILQAEKQARKDDSALSREAQRTSYLTRYYQKMVVEDLLEAIEDRSLEVALERVLTVGQKFSYLYDYGSSTYITLRVVAEREGLVGDQQEPVQLLAQNTAPTFPCIVCGKPATTIALGYFTDITDIAERVFCTACARKRGDEEGMLPLINSPRVGVL